MSDMTTVEATQKVNQLQLVFSKAMDVTFESIGPNDIKNCFGDLRGEFGNSLDGKLLQQLALSKNRLLDEFEDLCVKYNLVEELSKISERTKDINTLGRGGNISDNVMRSTRDALTSVEIEEMARLVQELEKENERLLEGRRIMSQKINEQIAAVQEEESKMKAVVDQL